MAAKKKTTRKKAKKTAKKRKKVAKSKMKKAKGGRSGAVHRAFFGGPGSCQTARH